VVQLILSPTTVATVWSLTITRSLYYGERIKNEKPAISVITPALTSQDHSYDIDHVIDKELVSESSTIFDLKIIIYFQTRNVLN
jgi:hypothetical protein